MDLNCRRRTLSEIQGPWPTPEGYSRPDAIARAWITGRCMLCGTCGDVLQMLGVTEEQAQAARDGFAAHVAATSSADLVAA